MPLVLGLDLVGTFVFALAGAMASIRRQLDIFGIAVVSFAAACSGGIVRDLMIGSVPPAALRGVMWQRRCWPACWYFAGIHSSSACRVAYACSMRRGIGGGIVRDVLLAQVPMVLRSDLYAVAALAGSSVVAIGSRFGLAPAATALAGGLNQVRTI